MQCPPTDTVLDKAAGRGVPGGPDRRAAWRGADATRFTSARDIVYVVYTESALS